MFWARLCKQAQVTPKNAVEFGDEEPGKHREGFTRRNMIKVFNLAEIYKDTVTKC